jgi:hypothetical protein
MKSRQKGPTEEKEEKRFKLCWENRAAAMSHFDRKYEKEISFGKTPALEWSRDNDKNTSVA